MPMETVHSAASLREHLQRWRRAGERIAFVPTMGNLHAGHLALVAQAREVAPRVVVSIFVNPTQFGPGEDLAAYPRTPQQDSAALQAAGADLLFLPEVDTLYPCGVTASTRVTVPGLNHILCGEFRPTHFDGVATVVARLFNLVQPDVAVFGEKDYQQLVLIRRMVRDLCWNIDILAGATVREADGLAMSSRNQYLTPAERAIAPQLQQALRQVQTALQAGAADFGALEAEAMNSLEQAGFLPEYVRILRESDLQPPTDSDSDLVVLAAARLGAARLIDNLRFSVA